jgi:hypothetical protein
MNTYPFAGEIKMEKVIKDGKEVNLLKPTVETPMAYTFTPHDREWVTGKEWARIDKGMNVIHLDMELCAKGPHNAYTALAMAIWNKAIETEREKVAAWMTQQGYATGHGDTIEDLLKELEWQIRESEREACAKVCEERQEIFKKYYTKNLAAMCAEAIRARSKCEIGDAGTKIPEDVSCKTHPDAPHGFDRHMSHTLDRYVCECEHWEPSK